MRERERDKERDCVCVCEREREIKWRVDFFPHATVQQTLLKIIVQTL